VSEFVASAFNKESFPKMTTSSGKPMPEVAIVGRSNVGKSSLINHLLRKKLAKTSSIPGKTQSINFFSVDDQFALVDLPGYGYAKVAKQVREKWGELIDGYLQNRATLRLILFLIDSRREMTEQDRALIDWAAFHQKPLLVIYTKADKLSVVKRNESARGSWKIRTSRKIDDFEPVCQPQSGQSPVPEHTLELSRARGQGGKMAQNGDFAGRPNFPTASTIYYSIKDPRARIKLISQINGLLHGTHQ
jgi:GTP-binding protein